jgi:hypothetical protein
MAGALLLGVGLFLPQKMLAGGPPPVITVQPLSQVVPLLGIAAFSVTASSGTTMSYQWFKDGLAIWGATSSSYTVISVLDISAGNYCVKVSNSGGWVISDNATLNVVAPPSILTQPQSQTAIQNDNVSFSAVASGTAPLGYQWFFNGASMGASGTNATLALTRVKANKQSGSYFVVLTNSFGSATSAVATLTVLVPPTIATPPQSQTVASGQNTSFTVQATGTAPLGYQWNFNGSPIPAATSSALTLTNVQTAQAGGYSVVVTNVAGSASSPVANLAVIAPFSLSVISGPATNPGCFTFGFSFPAGSNYVILASTDLQSWSPIATNTATSNTVVFTDTSASNYPQRFYRAMAQ